MRIERVRLETGRLGALARFYGETLGLPVDGNGEHVAVTVGGTTVEFVRGVEIPGYHFAVTVPRNRFADASAWLSSHTDRLADPGTGDHEFHFGFMDADAVYCCDPAGNVVEFVARHGLTNDASTDRPFGPRDLVGVSEVGLAVDDTVATTDALASLGLTVWPESTESFAVVGDDEGMFVVVPTGRTWFPTDVPAAVGPTSVVAWGTDVEPGETWTHPEHPYRLVGASDA